MNKVIKSVVVFLIFLIKINLVAMGTTEHVEYNPGIPSTIVGAKNLQELNTACIQIDASAAQMAIASLISDNPNIVEPSTQPEMVSPQDMVAAYVAAKILDRFPEEEVLFRNEIVTFHNKFVISQSKELYTKLQAELAILDSFFIYKVMYIGIAYNGISDVMVCLEFGAEINMPFPLMIHVNRAIDGTEHSSGLTESSNIHNVTPLKLSKIENKPNITQLLLAAGAVSDH